MGFVLSIANIFHANYIMICSYTLLSWSLHHTMYIPKYSSLGGVFSFLFLSFPFQFLFFIFSNSFLCRLFFLWFVLFLVFWFSRFLILAWKFFTLSWFSSFHFLPSFVIYHLVCCSFIVVKYEKITVKPWKHCITLSLILQQPQKQKRNASSSVDWCPLKRPRNALSERWGDSRAWHNCTRTVLDFHTRWRWEATATIGYIGSLTPWYFVNL